MTDAGLKHLARLPLTGVDLRRTRVSAQGFASLKKARPNCEAQWSEPNHTAAVVVLTLGGAVHVRTKAHAEDRPVRHVNDLPSEYFYLSRINLAEVAKPLAESLHKMSALTDPDFDGLKVLELSRTAITNDDLQIIKPLTSLTELSLARTKINDDGLAALKGMKDLRRLVLDGAAIRGPGLEHLKALPALTDLGLGCPMLTDLLLQSLAQLTKLEKLSLANSSVSDDGLILLHGLDHLRELELTGSAATEAGVVELRKALPKCKIIFAAK